MNNTDLYFTPCCESKVCRLDSISRKANAEFGLRFLHEAKVKWLDKARLFTPSDINYSLKKICIHFALLFSTFYD